MRIIVLSTFTDCYLRFTSKVRINLKWIDIEAFYPAFTSTMFLWTGLFYES